MHWATTSSRHCSSSSSSSSSNNGDHDRLATSIWLTTPRLTLSTRVPAAAVRLRGRRHRRHQALDCTVYLGIVYYSAASRTSNTDVCSQLRNLEPEASQYYWRASLVAPEYHDTFIKKSPARNVIPGHRAGDADERDGGRARPGGPNLT